MLTNMCSVVGKEDEATGSAGRLVFVWSGKLTSSTLGRDSAEFKRA